MTTLFGTSKSHADGAGVTGSGTNAAINIAVVPPADMVEGMLVILDAVERATSLGNGFLAMAATGGQTWFSGASNEGGSSTQRRHWCRFNGTWTADPSVAFDDFKASAGLSAVMTVFSPTVPGSTWVEDVAQAAGAIASAETLTPPAITTLTDNAVAVSLAYSTDNNNSTLTTPGNWSSAIVGHDNQSGNLCINVHYAVRPTAGTTGTYTLTHGANGPDGGRYINQAWYDVAPALAKLLKLTVDDEGQGLTGFEGEVFAAPTGGQMTGAKIGYFSGADFEATLEAGMAVLKVPVADFGGEALTTSDTPVACVRNATYTTGIIGCTIIEE